MRIERNDRKFDQKAYANVQKSKEIGIAEHIARTKELGIFEYMDYFFDKSIESYIYIENEIHKKIYIEKDNCFCSTLATRYIATSGMSISYTEEAVIDVSEEYKEYFDYDPSWGIGYVHNLQVKNNDRIYVTFFSQFSDEIRIPELSIEEGDPDMEKKLRVHFDMLIEIATSERLIEEYITILVEEGKYKRR